MKKRILSILLLCCMVLTMLPTTVLAADGPMDTIPKYDVSIDVYNRTSDISIKDSRSYYIYSSVPDKLRDTWAWDKKIFIKGDKTAPHVFIDGVNIEMSPSSKGPAIELNKKASAYIYFIGKNSSLQGADGRAAIQKNRSEGQLYVLARTGTTVTCKGGDKAAGIGGSYATRNISNGYYNGDMYGHGVNMHFGSRSNPDYWGGTIAAIGGRNGAGIGAGRGGAGEKLYFYSGTIQATGGRFASGIGGSYEGRGSEIYIHGGTVSAQGGEGGAGIGGGCWKTEQDMNGINAAHDIYISGGTVTAKGGYNGAGIGGGQYVPARNITVTGGVVTATGHYGAAIGGGRWCRGMDITLTDATLNLSTNYRSNGSDAAAVGYGDIVYKPEQLVADPSIATNDRIKVGSKDGKIVMLTANGHALRTDGKPSYFMHLTDFLIPDSDGMIDLSLLTLPYTQNYGWAITDLDVKMMETSCEGNHTYGWKNRNGCHVWGCTRCPARNPLERGPVPDGEHIPGEWENQEKKCTVCGHKLMKDTTPPVIEGIANGMEYTADDTDDGQPGTISFTVSDPVRDKEVSSGVKSVTINGEEQTVQTGQAYQLTAPDGGNNDAGAEHTVVATDNAGNTTMATVKIYRRHHVKVISPDGNGTASASPDKAVAGTEITLTATPKEDYRFKEWQVVSPAGLVITNNKFTMPDSNVEVKAIFEEDAPAPTAPAKPSIRVTGAYTYNGSEHTATVIGYDSATMDITGNTATDAGDYTVSVTSQTGKWADGSTDAVTAAWSIGKATQEAPTGLIGVAPTTVGGSDGKISGVTDKMEYRMEAEGSYTPCSGTKIENLSAGNYFVRYAEDNNHFASSDAAVTVGEGTPLADRTITFNAGDGSGSMGSVTVKAGTNYTLPACGFTAPADQQFKAWEIGGTEYPVNAPVTVTADITVKALWEDAPPAHEHSYGDWSKDGTSHWHECTDDDCPKKPESIKDKAAHVYTDDADTTCNVCDYDRSVTPPAPTEFIVTFDAGDGTFSVGSMTTTNQKLSSLPSASRSKHSFDGWYTEKNGGTKVTTDTVFSANTTVYAHWTYTGGYYSPVYYTLTFETNGGDKLSPVSGSYNALIDLSKYAPKRSGYAFTGWYSERSLTNKVSGVYLTKDMTVYAGWRVTTAPQTGDSSVLGLWGFSLCTSLAGCLALTTWQIRRRREEQSLQSIEK